MLQRGKDDALLIVGSKRHLPGQLALEDLGCSAACEEERRRQAEEINRLTKRVKQLEGYLVRYTGQEVDSFLSEQVRVKELMRQFQAHIKDFPKLVLEFEETGVALAGSRKWLSMQHVLQVLRAEKPWVFAGRDGAVTFTDYMLPIYSRWVCERNPTLAQKVKQNACMFDGYRPWEEDYGMEG